MHTFYEFFAGGGMARAGLGDAWRCLFANDIDNKKAAAYQVNWGEEHFLNGDIRDITTAQLPGRADLARTSFPSQDLSLAGNSAGAIRYARPRPACDTRPGTRGPVTHSGSRCERSGFLNTETARLPSNCPTNPQLYTL